MRRLLVLAGAIGLLTFPVATQARAAGANAGREEMAMAVWRVPMSHHGALRVYREFTIGGDRRPWFKTGSSRTSVFAQIGLCREKRTPHRVVTRCYDTVYGGGVAADAFKIDPTLKSASVNFSDRGRHFEASWAGSFTKSPGTYSELTWIFGSSLPINGAGAGLATEAKAKAEMFRHAFTSGAVFSWLEEGSAVLVDDQMLFPKAGNRVVVRVRSRRG